MPAEYAALGHAERPAAVHAREPGLDRHPGRRDLRQRRRRPALTTRMLYENMAQKFGGERYVGRRLAAGDPRRKRKKKKHKHKHKPKARSTSARDKRPAQSLRQAQTKHRKRRRKKARRRRRRRPLRVCHLPQLRRSQRSRGADHRPRHRVPLPDAAQADQGGGQDDRPARPRHRCSTVNHVVGGGRARRPQARAAHEHRRHGRIGLGLGAAGQRRPRPARLPARHVQRAAGQRQGQRQRPPAGRDGAPGRPTSRPRS